MNQELANYAQEQKVANLAPAEIDRAPFVFISHDHRDAPLAEAFANLLLDCSAGLIKSFRSSAQRHDVGLAYGSEWFPDLMSRLDMSTDVIALLTPNSVNRPWILFEAGVARGKLNTAVMGIAIGVPLAQAIQGPFAQFTNCDGSPESITHLLMQIAKRIPGAQPREDALRALVDNFLQEVNKAFQSGLLTQGEDTLETSASAARLFEEIKLMFANLPRLTANLIQTQTDPSDSANAINKTLLHLQEIIALKDIKLMLSAWNLVAEHLRSEYPTLSKHISAITSSMKASILSEVGPNFESFAKSLDEYLSSSGLTIHDHAFFEKMELVQLLEDISEDLSKLTAASSASGDHSEVKP